MSIPLPSLLRQHRKHEHEQKITPARSRLALGLWAWLARHPRLYRPLMNLFSLVLARLGKSSGRLSRLPLAGAWLQSKDLPAPQGPGFISAWARQRHSVKERP